MSRSANSLPPSLMKSLEGSTVSRGLGQRRRSSSWLALFVVLRRAAGYHEIRDDDLDGLVVLIERRRSHLDHSLIGTRPRGPYLEHLALDPQLIPGPHGSWPAELVGACAHDAAGGFQVALDQ